MEVVPRSPSISTQTRRSWKGWLLAGVSGTYSQRLGGKNPPCGLHWRTYPRNYSWVGSQSTLPVLMEGRNQKAEEERAHLVLL